MFILLHGPDTFRSREWLKKTIKEFQAKRDPTGINTVVFDAAKIEPYQILEAMAASPFLADKRMVAVERLSAIKDERFFDNLMEAVEKKRIPESTVMVVWEEELPKKKLPEFFDFLTKQEYSKCFNLPTKAEIGKWLVKEAKKNGLEIEKSALDFLVNHPVAQDSWQLANELEKLIVYTSLAKDESRPASQLGPGRITLKEMKLLLPAIVDENIFHFIDALVGRQAKEAIKLLQDQWETGDTGRVFNLLVGQWRNLLLIKDYLTLNPGVNSYQVAQVLGIHPFVVKKSLAVLPGFSFERLKEIYQELLEIDIKTKTGGGELKNLMEMLVAKICG